MKIVDLFYTIQGEGKYAGYPAIFIRFPDCNLFCGLDRPLDRSKSYTQEQINSMKSDKAKWVCDTMVQWIQKGKDMSVEKIGDFILKYYPFNRHIVFTGGEPLLHKDWIRKIMERMTDYDILWEIETNGTIEPLESNLPIHYNVSLKLSNSGLDEKLRIKKSIIDAYQERGSDVTWKFVVNDDRDMQEVLQIVLDNHLVETYADIRLMPAAYSREELIENSKMIVKLCKKYGFIYSPRLQIFIYDRVVGV